MRTDRLYAMTLYLLNHGKTSAAQLAKHFEVSVRTVQRDMDALCQAGIPVYALSGSNGGYAISESFTMNNQLISQEEFAYIATALQGLRTVTNHKRADEILDKLFALSNAGKNAGEMILDFSVLCEGDEKLLQALQSAVAKRSIIWFTYTNNKGETKKHLVEPIAVIFRWYAWYLLAYSIEKEDYRTYKLVRMSDLQITGEIFQREHASTESIIAKCDRAYQNNVPPTRVKMYCSNKAAHRIREYLNGKVLETYEDGSVVMEIFVVEGEQWWIGVVLSQGADVKILEPEHIRQRIIESAGEILFLYKEL